VGKLHKKIRNRPDIRRRLTESGIQQKNHYLSIPTFNDTFKKYRGYLIQIPVSKVSLPAVPILKFKVIADTNAID